jgi:maltoporin
MNKLTLKNAALVPFFKKLSAVISAVIALESFSVQATEFNGIELTGYMRAGAYSSPAGSPPGGYTLGGDTQKFRLGNEGDTYGELGIGKTFEAASGMKWRLLYMPSVWNGVYGTAQAFASVSGLAFAPEARFWAGQQYMRIQEVHIVDRYFMDYGDNIGVGMTDYNLGSAKLALGFSTGGSIGNNSHVANQASRINVDVSEMNINAGGTLRTLITLVQGNFQMGTPGAGLSISHNQADFLYPGLTHTVFLQSATGHAGLSGQFLGLGDAGTAAGEQPGANSLRVADSINWQNGPFGGQTLLAYQTATIQGGINNAISTRDVTLGARVSYAMSEHFKLLAEAGTTSRSIDAQISQRLNKFTIAPTLALAPDFWSRPELRFYITHASWNDAAAAANAGVGGFGVGGRTSSIIAGIQMEAWW